MKSSFETALRLVLVHEGGFANHPKDPGGRTMRGVTQRTYDAYRSRIGERSADVKGIGEDELRSIYRMQYWDKVMGDDLPPGLDYAVFDFAVNSGPSRAAKFLQKIVGAEQDGVIGAQTLANIKGRDVSTIIVRLCDDRLAWLKRLKTFATFGKGWSRRVTEVKLDALEMVSAKRPADRPPVIEPDLAPKTDGDLRSKASAQVADNADSLTAGGALTALITGTQVTDGAAQLVLVAGAVALVAFFVWIKWNGRA